MEEFAENKLLIALKKGDKSALDKLYLTYVQSLYSFVLKTAKSPKLSEDVVQDVFVKIWEHRERIDTDRPFKAYLFAIARNHLLNLLKRARHEHTIVEEMRRYTVYVQDLTEQETNYRESEALLQKALDQLAPKCRAVFVRCKLDGLPYKKVAEEMGITEGTVNSQVVKATKIIKKYFSFRHISLLLLTLFH